MEFWEENRKAILGCGAALLVLLLAHLFFFGPMWKRVASLKSENDKKTRELSSFYPDGGVSVETLKSAFGLGNARLRKEYEGLTGKMELELKDEFIVPADENQPGFYMRKLLTNKRYEVLFYCSTRGMDSIDRSLGFGENIPPDEAVPEMLIQLASACELVRAAADAGVKTVSSIRNEGVSRRGAPGYAPFVEERGISLTMRCSLDALVKFIHSLDKRKYFFGLKSLSMESALGEENRLLTVGMECATFRFSEPAEPIKKQEKGPPGGPGRTIHAPTYPM